jgi:hypothetical protein
MAHEISNARFLPDFSEDDLLQSAEKFINGAYYPKYDVQLCRMSRMHLSDIGINGELVSAVPFYFNYRTASFVPRFSSARIHDERTTGGFSESELYCFTATADPDTLEYRTHNALVRLSRNETAGYAVPLFYRRWTLTMLRRNLQPHLWHQDDEISGEDSALKNKSHSLNSPLLREIAVISPDTEIEKAEARNYICYNRIGELSFHHDGSAERISQNRLLMGEHVSHILSLQSEERTLVQCAGSMIESVPELFGQSWQSRKMKSIVEDAVFECIDENELPAHSSAQKALARLTVQDQLIVIEKLLKNHFGIVQYFKLRYRN